MASEYNPSLGGVGSSNIARICQRRKEERSHRVGQRDMTEEDRGICQRRIEGYARGEKRS